MPKHREHEAQQKEQAAHRRRAGLLGVRLGRVFVGVLPQRGTFEQGDQRTAGEQRQRERCDEQ